MGRFFDLTGKVAIVTGGNGGIGLGIAEGLAQAGAKLAIIGRNAEKSQTAAKVLSEQTGSEPLALIADVAKPNEVNVVVNTVPTLGVVPSPVTGSGVVIDNAQDC